MFIEIESPNKKTKLNSVEIGKLVVSFFFSDFIYLNFKDLKEKSKFFEELFFKIPKKLTSQESYAEINSKKVSKEEELSKGFNIVSTERFDVKEYKIKPHGENIEVIFYSSKEEKIRFVLYKKVIEKLKEEIK